MFQVRERRDDLSQVRAVGVDDVDGFQLEALRVAPVMRPKAIRRPPGEYTGSTPKMPWVSCLAPVPLARMVQMLVWKPG